MNTNLLIRPTIMLNATLQKTIFLLFCFITLGLQGQSVKPLATYKVTKEYTMGGDTTSDALKAGTVFMFYLKDDELYMSRNRIFEDKEEVGAMAGVKVANVVWEQADQPWQVILEFSWLHEGAKGINDLDAGMLINGNIPEQSDMVLRYGIFGNEMGFYELRLLEKTSHWEEMVARWRQR